MSSARTPADIARRNVFLFFAFGASSNFLLWGGVWIKYLVDERGLELRWILAMDLPFWLIAAALQAPTGALADRIGRKRVLAMSGALYVVTILGFGFTTNYWMLFFDYVIWAFAIAMQTGADQALVYDSLRLAGRESQFRRIASRQFAVSLAAGAVSLILGGLLASATSLTFTVQFAAICPAFGVVIALLMVEPPRERAPQRYLEGLKRGFSFGWSNKEVRYTLLIGAVFLTATFGPVVLIQPFLLEHDVATSLYGVYQAPLRIVSVLAAVVAFAVVARLGVGRTFVAGGVAIVACFVGLAALDREAAFVFFGLSSVVQGVMSPMVSGHLNERIPSELRATVLSLMQLAFSLQVAFFEPALGFLTDDVSLGAAFIFSALYCGLLLPPLIVLWRRAHQGGASPPLVPRALVEVAAD